MNFQDRKIAFCKLADKISGIKENDLEELIAQAQSRNGWFSTQSIKHALNGISFMLDSAKMDTWLKDKNLNPEVPKIVGIVMAGNIPLVGFHDLMCVLLSGHLAALKLSSKDEVLMRQIIQWLEEIEPRFKRNIQIKEKLDSVDAVIATGSDNTARYFEYYFKQYPHIIRKNRTSVAVLSGSETAEDLVKLGDDIFTYFGLGCRNVSKIFTPVDYDIKEVFPHWQSFENVIHHHKYSNNYEYYKSIFLVNKDPHLDTGYLLVKSIDDLVSPTSVLYHQEYDSMDTLNKILETNQEKIQCVVGNGEDMVPFGSAQSPEPWDYADGVDVMAFLEKL